ncbi:glycosyltransferase family 2 protein [Parasphingorhabdus sp. DH2-15]|uniref:glycosyltransferase family 2 protein n=1 Tax=Parasphingorhabdus sp. DH2-15 TaxID=3444112 RepID=UPI003F6858B7
MTKTTKISTRTSIRKPKISVVMPVYNVERYVAEAVQSVLDQSFEEFELIIVDDGGQDDSIAICSAFKDPRIRIISQRNRGLAGARNTGILESWGRYVAFLDSDDSWMKDKLMLHFIHLENNPDVDVSYSGSRFMDENGHALRQAQKPKLTNIDPRKILLRNPVGNGSAPVIRRTALNNVAYRHPEESWRLCYFDETLRQSEDIEMWLRLSMLGQAKFEGVDGLLTNYRIVGGALSANIIAQYESWETMLDKTRSYAPQFVALHEREARAFQLRYLARRAIQLGDGTMAMMLIRDAISYSLKPLYREPGRSLATVSAALAMRFLPTNSAKALANRWTGSKALVG